MFETIENVLYPIIYKFNEYISNYLLVFMLTAVGLWYTFKTKFIQVRCFKDGFKYLFGNVSLFGKANKGSMTSFQALATAIAAQVGTGTIIGSSAAILIGGPGAIFWMWLLAFLGMATIYAEATLAIKTRKIDEDGNIKGGSVYYIREAFKGKLGTFLAGFFAISIILALGFMGCMVQSNAISFSIQSAFGIPTWIMGIFLVIASAAVFLGDIKRLASVTEKLVPIMAGLFIIGCLIVLIARIKYIPETFHMIFKYAFEPQAILGGGFWCAFKTAVSQGGKKGLFANEAGLGSTPHAHALANVKTPHEQGTIAMMGVFLDTFIIITLNALVIISTLYTADGPLFNGYIGNIATILNENNVVQISLSSVLGKSFGTMFIAICLFFFGFSTILSWNLFGKVNAVYLFSKIDSNKVKLIYTIIALLFIMLGSMLSSKIVWGLSDMFNNLMVIPNVLALFVLTKLVKSCYEESKNNQ